MGLIWGFNPLIGISGYNYGILPGSVGITVSLWDYMSNVKKLDANWFIWELQKKTTKHWVFDTVHVRFQLIKIVVIINN